MTYHWFDSVNKELLDILLRYAQARYPREKASYLQVAIGRLLAHTGDRELRERLNALSQKVKEVSFGYHWELYMGYAFGNYSLMDDEEYEELVRALEELDDVALEISRILGEVYVAMLNEYMELKSKRAI